MEHKKIYKCTGNCNGVSPVAKSCGASTCSHFNQPLQAVEQCDACANAAEKDGGNHACKMCKIL